MRRACATSRLVFMVEHAAKPVEAPSPAPLMSGFGLGPSWDPITPEPTEFSGILRFGIWYSYWVTDEIYHFIARDMCVCGHSISGQRQLPNAVFCDACHTRLEKAGMAGEVDRSEAEYRQHRRRFAIMQRRAPVTAAVNISEVVYVPFANYDRCREWLLNPHNKPFVRKRA